MNTIGKPGAIFIGLAVGFGALVLVANTLPNTFSQLLLVSLGSVDLLPDPRLGSGR